MTVIMTGITVIGQSMMITSQNTTLTLKISQEWS